MGGMARTARSWKRQVAYQHRVAPASDSGGRSAESMLATGSICCISSPPALASASVLASTLGIACLSLLLGQDAYVHVKHSLKKLVPGLCMRGS